MRFGTVTNFDDSATVRFERVIAVPQDSVWQGLTNETLMAEWLAPTTLEPVVAGRVTIDFGDEQKVEGSVIEIDPQQVLEYSWTFSGEGDSILRFELSATGDDTNLVLEHRRLPPDQAVGYGAGWHAHLDSLQAMLENTGPVDWDARFNEVLGTYAGA